MPVRDWGIDLIAYLDLAPDVERDVNTPACFVARPIQMKVQTDERFIMDEKYAKFPDLVLVHIWQADDPACTAAYGLTYAEMLGIAPDVDGRRPITGRRVATTRRRSPAKS